MTWWRERMVGFDLESTSPLPEEARIVQFAVAHVGGGLATEAFGGLVNPGVPIPEGASAVHGITDEMLEAADAVAEPADAVNAIIEAMAPVVLRGGALVVFNSRYDLTVLDREARRYGITPLHERGMVYVFDPMVTDKFLDRYRKSYPYNVTPELAKTRGIASTRTLEGMCGVYGVALDGAHDATFDAIAAARLAWMMGARSRVVRKARDPEEQRELELLREEWELIRHDLPALHEAQQRWAIEERERFADYKLSMNELEEATRIRAERGWPVLEVMEHEEVG